MHPLALPWFAEVGVITVRDFSDKHRPPLPSELLASFVVFGALGLFAGVAPRGAVLAGWGLVVATLLSSQVDVLGPFGDFMAGRKAGAAIPPVDIPPGGANPGPAITGPAAP